MKTQLWLVAALVGILVLSGCGMEDSASAFTGVWKFNPGSNIVLTCPNGMTRNMELVGNTTFVKGTSADLFWDQGGCSWNFDVNGSTATVVPGQECLMVSELNNTQSWAWATLSMTRSGESMTITGSGNIKESNVSCATTMNAALIKVGG